MSEICYLCGDTAVIKLCPGSDSEKAACSECFTRGFLSMREVSIEDSEEAAKIFYEIEGSVLHMLDCVKEQLRERGAVRPTSLIVDSDGNTGYTSV